MSQSRIIFIQRPPRPRPARSRAARPHATAALTDCKRETNLSRSGSRVGRSVPSSDSTSARAPARPRCFQMTRKKEGRVGEGRGGVGGTIEGQGGTRALALYPARFARVGRISHRM